MQDKKPADRGVADSIARLRMERYMAKGPGAKHTAPARLATVEQLRAKVAGVKVKISKKKSRKNRARR